MSDQNPEWVHVCEALVVAIQYLRVDRNDEEHTEEDDLKIVEYVASLLAEATVPEREGLIAASRGLGLSDWATQIGIE